MGQKQPEGKSQASSEKSRQPAVEQEVSESPASVLASNLAAAPSDQWPQHPTSAPLRQQAILQLQRSHGNARVEAIVSAADQTATPAVQRFPGGRSGRGYRYGGGGSAGYTRREVDRAIASFERDNRPQLADACRVFLELAPMEGWISAINTWDSQIFTWGAGFAHGGMLSAMWRYLDRSVKSYLASSAQPHFAGGRLNITNAIRTDTAALDAVVHVSENDPYREHVLRAQLRAFMEQTMGVSPTPAAGQNFPTRDRSVLALAAHLRHWTPGLFDMPGDLEAAISAAGGVGAGEGATAEPLAIAAAIIRTHAQNMLATGRFGENGPRRRRVFDASMLQDWNPVMRYQRNLDNLFSSAALPAMATSLLPAFQSSSNPYFVGENRLVDLPENHFIMMKGRTYYDFGPRS